jgi:hypothetical protein
MARIPPSDISSVIAGAKMANANAKTTLEWKRKGMSRYDFKYGVSTVPVYIA